MPRSLRPGAARSGRRHRRVARRGRLAHVEVRGLDGPRAATVAAELGSALDALPSVARAWPNVPLGRLVVELVDESTPLGEVLAVLEGVESALDVGGDTFPTDRPDHPADAEPLVREGAAAAAALAALGAGTAGRLAHLPRLPAELGGLVSWAESQPRLRAAVEWLAGPTVGTLGLSFLNAALQAAGHGPLGPLADLGHRLSLVGEARARQAAWDRMQHDLHRPGRERGSVAGGPGRRPDASGPAPGPAGAGPTPRSVPLAPGPVESFADQAAVASLAAAGGTFLATADPRRSTAAALAATPKAARLGRDAFAAHLDRVLAARDVLCLDTAALRLLDRIDTVLLDASAVATGTFTIDAVEVVGDVPGNHARRRARDLFDGRHPHRTVHAEGWSLSPRRPAGARDGQGAPVPAPTAAGPGTDGGGTPAPATEGPTGTEPGLPAPATEGRPIPATATGGTATDALVLRHGADTVAFVTVREDVDPMARTLARAARDAGHMVAVAGSPGLADRLGAHLQVEGGDGPDGLLASVRMLQADGCGVALLAATDGDALSAADLGLGLVGADVPWHADVLVHDLAGAGLVVDALAVAHDVSRQSAAIALGGTAVGGVLALTSLPARAAARVTASVNGAALGALANGVRAALGLAAQPAPTPEDDPAWHELDADEVLARLESGDSGLAPAEAARRARRGAAVDDRPVALPVAVLEEMANPLTPVLAGAAMLSGAVGSVADAAMVSTVAALNALVGGVQRHHVERAVRQLEVASTQPHHVRRSGELVTVPAAELVPGDVVVLSAGDSVPADCRILEAAGLEVDESSLTGESIPVAKGPVASTAPTPAERTSMVYEGTVVAAGQVVGAVVATGRDTEAHRRVPAPRRTGGGVEARLRDLTRVTVPLAGVAGAGIVAAGLLRGQPLAEGLQTGVNLAVAAVPEGLPILATMAQLGAARRLSTRGALVRNPRAVEALGRVDLLCCDKTGTLTEGRIELDAVSDGRIELEVPGPGAAVLAAAVRASPPVPPGDDPLPHLTDRAVVEGAARRGVEAGAGVTGWHRRAELPFEPARGYHAVLGRDGGSFLLSVKGAPEVVVPRCGRWQVGDTAVDLDGTAGDELRRHVDGLARRGYRVLAVAEREASGRVDLDDDRVDGLTLLGFVALSDPVRPTAAAAVAALAAAGIGTVMITGDHPSTAEGIAAELGLLNGRAVVTGADLDTMDDGALDAVVDDTTVFARVTPAHKVRLVEAYRRRGRAVAMTGDGANDAPAIRAADVGVALGEHSTSAARAVADVVVTDGRIETLIDAVVEGRAMWASVREALAILVGGNVGEIAFTLGTGAVTGTTLSPRQLLLVNLFTDAVPSLAIAMRTPRHKGAEDLLGEGPEASLGVALERQVVTRALATAAGAGVAWAGARATGRARRASTVALAGLVGAQLGQTLVVGGPDPVVALAGLGSAAALAAVIQTPGLSRLVDCTPLGPLGWGLALAGTATGVGLSLVLPPLVDRLPLGGAHQR
ncbi:MAG TPA: HAD-IC family P-type ATPase [Acidimicrobiales bacterium]|nr:HAD-IC family P-type ATPase [Acidimicrobiales bacterium]